MSADRAYRIWKKAVLQFPGPPYRESLLQKFDRLAAEHGGLLEVRFYGHYQGGFDFRTLENLPHVVRLFRLIV